MIQLNMDGILNINKPSGMSSFKCLSIVKRKLGLKKVGHLGTLDPLASGVLVLLCGSYTRRMEELSAERKTYRSWYTFGKETTTLDEEGEIIATSDVLPTQAQIEAILPSMIGDIEIEVPKFSAVHINGQRAYDLARKGVDFVAPRRIVNIKRFELLDKRAENEYFFEIECQTGTYIRSLAKLMAQRLGTVAIASTIIRTKVGRLIIEDAKGIEDVEISDLQLI